MKVFFKTFGCRTNFFDTQVMIEKLKDFSIIENEHDADIIIVNSCTVTNGADSGVRSYVNKMKREGKKIYFTGCGVKTQAKNLFDKDLIFGSFGHSHKEKINDFLLSKDRFFIQESETTKHLDSTIVSDFSQKSRAFIKIQEGCDFSCSYCIIPSVRGIARSYRQEDIIKQIDILAQKGISEVVLTGTNVGSYGRDLGSNIARLIKEIAKNNSIKRVRVGSLEPSQINGEFLELLEDDILEKHLHIALQYTHNDMLKIMNRQNRVETDFILLEKIAKKGFAIGSDFIVGHPYETPEIWEEALKNIKSLPLTHIHPFIYSPRDNTPSAKMPMTVDKKTAKERLNDLNKVIKQKNLIFRKKKSVLRVLVESKKQENYSGLDQFFNRIVIKSHNNIQGNWLEIKDYEVREEGNYAEI
ncbi:MULTISPECIES: tRNA (N(6)-L-threonylcarbamoyladenosine(37)-C(2))-methylthiotransferase MtaB [unclassified Helicobacter]|uniref:tRNA (N(6)-L-threonylcarbamoyladenosine(37)-C(2))- methylthiotransferase MtaB n=1 Tax=unclassified Helicobacter TaxID=2593540 RepID=UPI000CF0435E|nr:MULTISPECIES: tRNA (N(6)-L-threonylcarbamoyladenosine(37)-C(2))-methylthiotransferase MtaB [unclassified Helicobacter]